VDVDVCDKSIIVGKRQDSAASIEVRMTIEAGVRGLNAAVGIAQYDVLPAFAIHQHFELIGVEIVMRAQARGERK
jgi:hypothetical protein